MSLFSKLFKPKFVSPEELMRQQAHSLRRAMRRIPNRGPLDHATGTGFVPDESTTRAVLRRMGNMPWYLQGKTPPMLDDPRRNEL